ncbi:MAG: peptide ABC transporter substrate-binding protein, partial [Saccharolobus sp.]
MSKTVSLKAKILSFTLLVAMLISSIYALAQPASMPASTSITFISYNGNDANGILAFEHGQIAFYAYSIPPSEYTALPPGAKAYIMPSTYYD